jgi:hypothetical protein
MTTFWNGLYLTLPHFVYMFVNVFFFKRLSKLYTFSHLSKTKGLVSNASISLNIFGQDQTNGSILIKDEKDYQTISYSQFQILSGIPFVALSFRVSGLLTLTGTENLSARVIAQGLESSSEIKFLDINLTKDSSLLLLAIHSLSTGGFL